MSEGDRAFTTAALILHGEYNRGRDTLPLYEVSPGLFMTVSLVHADQLRPNNPPLFAEPIA